MVGGYSIEWEVLDIRHRLVGHVPGAIYKLLNGRMPPEGNLRLLNSTMCV
jgi:hypothetical protein